MNKITYEFSYDGKVKIFLSKLIILLYNCFCGLIFNFIFAYIVFDINLWLINRVAEGIMDKIKLIEICFGIAVMLVLIFISFLPQKVKIVNDKIKVYRHCIFLLPFDIWKGFNDNISIDKIDNISLTNRKEVGHILFFEPIPVGFIDWKNMVIINTKRSCYYIPVKNSDDFIKQVNLRMERIKFLEKYNLNSVIAARGISPEQIKFRWKSQDELESVYYIDYQGNKVDIPFPNNKSE